MSETPADFEIMQRRRMLRWHLMAYGGACVMFFIADIMVAGPTWFHWPVMAWGAVAGAHYLYCKSVSVDDEWAEQRTLDIKLKSYDLGHIQAIDESFKKNSQPPQPSPEKER